MTFLILLYDMLVSTFICKCCVNIMDPYKDTLDELLVESMMSVSVVHISVRVKVRFKTSQMIRFSTLTHA